jgi:hypothetical protein
MQIVSVNELIYELYYKDYPFACDAFTHFITGYNGDDNVFDMGLYRSCVVDSHEAASILYQKVQAYLFENECMFRDLSETLRDKEYREVLGGYLEDIEAMQ